MSQNFMQNLIDGMSLQWQKERSETQMTLGRFIEILEQLPDDMKIDGLHSPHSYRGYYCDLAFERCERKTVRETIQMLRECLGEKFEGYKGGDFYMTKNTPIWIAQYGICGERIINIALKTGEIVAEIEHLDKEN